VRGRGGGLSAWFVAALALAAGVLLPLCLLGAASASAAGYVHKEEFSTAGGQVPSFVKPVALAVDPVSGDLLVVDVEAKTIHRFKPDGSADNFSALGTNMIDGQGILPCTPPSSECDGTPQNGLDFGFGNPREVQVAIAPPGSAGGTAGDIYVTQPRHSHNLIDIFAPSGAYLGQLIASSEGSFGGVITGVAVDSAGSVYVSDTAGKIHKYVPTANPVTNANNTANFTRETAASLAAGIGSTAGSIFSDKFGSEPVKLNSGTGAQQCVISSGESVTVTVNPTSGAVFSATESEATEYEGSCAAEPLPRPSIKPVAAGIKGIAAIGETVYLSREGHPTIEVWERVKLPEAITEPPSPIEVEGATLRGEANPEGIALGECLFRYQSKAEYLAAGNKFSAAAKNAPCEEPDAAGVGTGSSFVPVHAKAPLASGTEYVSELFLVNENTPPGEPVGGGTVEFATPGAQINGESASQITATGALVSAGIDPKGEATAFQVEYLSEAAYLANSPTDRFAGATVAPAFPRTIPATATGTGEVREGSKIVYGVHASAGTFGAGQAITGPGIPPGTRIKAVLSTEELELSATATAKAIGAALSATGPQPSAQQLLGLEPLTTYHYRVAATNAQSAHGPDQEFTTFGPAGPPLPDGRAYELITPAAKAGEAIPPEPDSYLGGSCSFCLPGVNEATLPLTQAAPDGNAVFYAGQPFGAGLVSGANEYLSARNTGGWGWQSLSAATISGRWQAFSADLGRGILAQSEPPLSPLAPFRGGRGFAELYLWEAGAGLAPLITVEPPNRDPGAGVNQFRVRYAAANAGAPLAPAFSHVALEANDALTEETATAPPAPPVPTNGNECSVDECDLYEWSGGHLALVNVAPGNAGTVGGAVIGSGRLLDGISNFLHEAPNTSNAISEDGTRVFWSSGATGHAYARVGGEKTLMLPGPATCEEGGSEPACFLTASSDGAEVLLANGQIDELQQAGGPTEAYAKETDLTEGKGGFEGILGASRDLSRVYFVDTKALPGAAGQQNAAGERPEDGKLNLYAYGPGGTRFIGALSGEDRSFELGRYGTWKAAAPDRVAQVSADGRFLAFMSRAAPTGYDNELRGGGECRKGLGSKCTEVYEYAAETNILTCASCDPSGQRPAAGSNLSAIRPGSSGPPFRQLGNLSADGEGRLFFESGEELVPQDTNGNVVDVYEWEPDGIGSCQRAGGCVSLISSGQGSADSMFVDSSANGDDAFFITRSRLLRRDENDQLDVYDARVDGGFGEEAAQGCSGEGCRGPLAEAPAQPSAASSSYAGPGNPKPEKPKKKKHKKHAKKKKGKKHGKHKRGGRR